MKTIALALLTLIPATLSSEMIVDLVSIAGKTKNEVALVLGDATPADEFNQEKYGEKLYYQERKFEIVYRNGYADWITITGLKNIPFESRSIRSLGFKNVPQPTFQNQHIIRWVRLGGAIRQIQMSPDQEGKVWMFYIQIASSVEDGPPQITKADRDSIKRVVYGKSAQEYVEETPAGRKKRLERGFSLWDGSHRELTNRIKRLMHDPGSYDHLETVYWDMGDHLVVRTEFQGKNMFGSVVKNWIKAKVDLDGKVIEIIEQSQ